MKDQIMTTNTAQYTLEGAVALYKTLPGTSSKAKVVALIDAGYTTDMAVDASWRAEKGIKTPAVQGDAYGPGRDYARYESAMDRTHEDR